MRAFLYKKMFRNIFMSNKIYILIIPALFTIVLISVSCQQEYSKTIPTVVTLEATSITSTTSLSGGTISDDGGAIVTSRGMCWSIDLNPDINDNKTIDGKGIGSYISSITDLNPAKKYYARAYAINSIGTAYGNLITFTTNSSIPVIAATEISVITAISASCNVNISSDGGSAITARGVCWSTSQNPTTSNSKTSNGSGVGSFVSSITGLIPAMTYYVRVYANNSIGTTYGNQISFTTSATVHTVTTLIIDTLKFSPIIVGGIVPSDESPTFTERGILYGLSTNLTVSNSTLVGSFKYGLSSGGFDTPSTSNGKITSGSGKGTFSSTIKYLLGSRTYYVRAYAINSNGVFYGDILKFNTKNYTRDPRGSGISNVSWISSFTLFDLQTDEIILPNSVGNFEIFYSSNEDPQVHQVTLAPSSLPNFRLYKFKTKENCQLWCDIKNGVKKP